MTHLMKDADGHLVRNPSGHLARCCECNDCDPPIPCALEVTFAGLAGDLAALNGANTAAWTFVAGFYPGCLWVYDPAPGTSSPPWVDPGYGTPIAYLYWSVDRWTVAAYCSDACWKYWRKIGDACDPTGNYAEWACQPGGCADHDTCVDSAGATCTVSYL